MVPYGSLWQTTALKTSQMRIRKIAIESGLLELTPPQVVGLRETTLPLWPFDTHVRSLRNFTRLFFAWRNFTTPSFLGGELDSLLLIDLLKKMSLFKTLWSGLFGLWPSSFNPKKHFIWWLFQPWNFHCHNFPVSSPLKINDWFTSKAPRWKGTSFEPNRHDLGCKMFIFQGVSSPLFFLTKDKATKRSPLLGSM